MDRCKWKTYLALAIFILVCHLISAQDVYEVINVSHGLNVRSTPSTQGKVVGTLQNGTLVNVMSTSNEWAEILYKDKEAWVALRYLQFKEKKQSDTLPSLEEDTIAETASLKANEDIVITNTFSQKWGIDFLPSIYIGASDFIGDYRPKAHFGFGFDARFQIYQKQNDLPRGWMSEASVGYALKGGGGMPVHYFTMLILPAGYAYTFEKQDIILYALLGLSLNFGGGHLTAYRNGVSKTYHANPCDVGMQLKIATEWRKFGFAISYDQGFINVIENTSLGLKNFGFNFHFYYRLWDIPNNQIYKP